MPNDKDLDKVLKRAVAFALSGTDFRYRGETFMIDVVNWSRDDGVLEVEASGGPVNDTGQRVIYFALNVQDVEDVE